MSLIEERGDNSKISPTPADGPEKIGVFFGARRDKASIRQYHIGRQEIIDRQAVFPRQIARSATQRKSSNPGQPDHACGDGVTEGMAQMVHIDLTTSGLGSNGRRGGIKSDTLHVRKINHHAVIAGRQTRTVVSAAANRDRHVVLSREGHGQANVRRVATSDN